MPVDPRGQTALQPGSDRYGDLRDKEVAMETMIGIGVLLAGIGVLWLCFAIGVYFFTRTGREGIRIQRMEDERRERLTHESP
jgi:hypothetical protein